MENQALECMTNSDNETIDQSQSSPLLGHHATRLRVLKDLQDELHANAVDKGFWEKHDKLLSYVASGSANEEHTKDMLSHVDLLYQMSRTMLVASELSEGVEGLRHGNPPDDKIPEFDSFSVELADAVIRIFDMAGRFNLPVIDAIVAKAKFNTTRSHRHGCKQI